MEVNLGSKMPENNTSENTFRILISTDNHVGYAEKDGLRGVDSFRTFEEILRLAVSHDVDFVLFSGDIFHDSRPSMRSVHEVLRLLRTYCLGEKPVRFELLSEPKTIFANTAFSTPNYLDGNLNVGIPVFTIHGNHDDPSGPGGLCAADLLHTAGLVNLFGKVTSVERIDINPVLLKKGTTRLAIYGLGAVREERLHRLFLNNGVTFYRPTEHADDWFSLCTVHQNRVRHGPTGYLPEHFLPEFLDLVIWGHEHECRIEPEWNSSQNFYVVQPGSSVATALSEGEAREKAVGLLEVRGKEFKVTRLPLCTVRPFLFHDLILQEQVPKLDPNSVDVVKKIELLCSQLIETEIKKSTLNSAEILSNENQSSKSSNDSGVISMKSESHQLMKNQPRLLPPLEPLIRLRIDLSGGYESFSSLRFGQKYVGRVANPKDLVTFNRNKEKLAMAQANRAEKSGISQTDSISHKDLIEENELKKIGLDANEVEELIRQYLLEMIKSKDQSIKNEFTNGLTLFTTYELEHGLRKFVNHGVSDAINTTSSNILTKTLQYLRIRKVPEERVINDVISFCYSRGLKSEQNPDLDNDNCEADLDLIIPESTKQQVNKNKNEQIKEKRLDWSLIDDDEEAEDENQETFQSNLKPQLVKPKRERGKSTQSIKKPVGTKNFIGKTKFDDDFDSNYDHDEDCDLADLVEEDDSGPESSNQINNSNFSKPINQKNTINKTNLFDSFTNQSHLQTGGRGRGKTRGSRTTRTGTNQICLVKSSLTNISNRRKTEKQQDDNENDSDENDSRHKRRKLR